MLYVSVPTGPNDGTTLVSSLQSLLVYEEFYSIQKCTKIGLLGVLHFFTSSFCHWYPIQSEKTNINKNVRVGILLLF